MLDRFSEFLEGFLMLLRGHQVKRLTYSHRIFISNFVKNSGLARALKTKHPLPAAFHAGESAMISVSTQLKPIEDEDIRQEITEVFLATLRRYRSRDNQNYLIPYILKSFPYALTRRVQQIVKDPLVNLQSDKIDSLEGLSDVTVLGSKSPTMASLMRNSHTNRLALSTTYAQTVINLEEDDLGHSWLRGDLCNHKFDNLSYAERKILKSFYYLEMTDAQIAIEMGISYNTAIRRRHHIESKLRGSYTVPTCRFCGKPIDKAPLGRQPRQCIDCRKSHRSKRRRIRAAHSIAPVIGAPQEPAQNTNTQNTNTQNPNTESVSQCSTAS